MRKEASKSPVVEPGRVPQPEYANLTVELLKPVQHSKRYAIANVDSLGVIERFTYADITRETARWGQLLRDKGLEPGDRVVIVAEREWSWRCALLGAIHAGGVAVPCPASLSLREIRSVADHAGASLLVSLRPRPELVELDGRAALTADDLDGVDPARALERRPHRTESRDIALILYAWHGLELTGTMHTHASLLAQADSAEHWLGVNEDERIWATAEDGSAPSIWLLLAAWRRAASIVVVDLDLDSEAKLELLDRLRPAAVWFADDEYQVLGSADVPAWVDLRSIRRALVDTDQTDGAVSFATAFGAALVPVFALDELGVVAGWPAGHEGQADTTTAQPTPGVQFAVVGGDGTELPPGEVGDVAVRSDAPTLFTGYAGREGRSRSAGWFRFGWRGALTAEGALRLEERSPSEVEPVDASADLPVPEVAEEPGFDEPLSAVAEPAELGWRARRAAERARRDQERAADEERRRHEEEEAREIAAREEEIVAQGLAGRQAAEAEQRREKERRRDEQEAREREAREAKEREKAEAEASKVQAKIDAADAKQRAKDEKERAKREAKERSVREKAEAEAAKVQAKIDAVEAKQRAKDDKEREKREAVERAEREKAEAEAEKARQRQAEVDAKKRAEEEKRRAKEREREEKEARRRAEQEAKEAARAERKAARSEKRRPKEAPPAEDGKRRFGRRREAVDEPDPRHVEIDVVARIRQYGMAAEEPSEAADAEPEPPPGESG